MTIGTVDLVATAVLHAQGKIVELNPVMKVFIERSEWLFAFVKGMTLLVAFLTMRAYAKKNRQFVHRACLAGSAAYVTIWTVWFFGA
ncbi:MAG: DUF5658 family protein [Fimbriimonas sp.]